MTKAWHTKISYVYKVVSDKVIDKNLWDDAVQECLINLWIIEQSNKEFTGNPNSYFIGSIKRTASSISQGKRKFTGDLSSKRKYDAYSNSQSLNYGDETNEEGITRWDDYLEASEDHADKIINTHSYRILARNLMRTLNPRELQVVEYMFYDGLTNREIADKLDTSPDYIRVMWSRARLKMREFYYATN